MEKERGAGRAFVSGRTDKLAHLIAAASAETLALAQMQRERLPVH